MSVDEIGDGSGKQSGKAFGIFLIGVAYALHMRDEVDDASVDVQLASATSGTCTSAPIAARLQAIRSFRS